MSPHSRVLVWLRGLLALLACTLLAGTAAAQDAANGQALYTRAIVSGTQSCSASACHGGLPANAQNRIINGTNAARIKSALSGVGQMRFLAGRLSDSELNDLAAYIASTLGGTPSYISVSGAPSAGVSPASVRFAAQNINTTSAEQTVVVSNAAGASGTLNITGVEVTAGSDFVVAGGNCTPGTSVSAGSSCMVQVAFRPTAVGERAATLTIRHNGSGSASSVALAGTAVDQSPAVSVSPSQLTYSRTVGSTSEPLRATVSSTGTAPLTLSSIQLTGTHAGDFVIDPSSTCAAGGSVASGSNCFVAVRFRPTAQGARSASLSIAHNAAASPSVVALSGSANATAQAGLSLDATALSLGSQVVGTTGTAKTLTLLNNGEASLSFSAISTRGADMSEFVLGGTCAVGAPVAPQGSCTITVALRPSSLGAKTATLDIASNAPAGTASVSLSGTGINAPAPLVSLSPVALGFGTVTIGTRSTARSITLTNTGTGPLSITRIESSSAEFQLTHNCPASVAQNASCQLNVVYAPTSANAAESILIVSDAISSPNSIVLTGVGSSTAMPTLAWQGGASSLSFPATAVGSTSAAQRLTLVNQGPGAVTLGSIGVSGADASSFSVVAGTGCAAGATLAQGASCAIDVSFVPSAGGAKAGVLHVASNGTAPPDVQLSGSGSGNSGGAQTGGTLSLSTSMLDYRSIAQATGHTSSPLSVLLSNTSAAAVTISAISATGPFRITGTEAADACRSVPWVLQPGSTCRVSVVYEPGVAGESTGILTVSTSTGQSQSVTLMGQSTAEMTNVGGGAVDAWLLALMGLALAAAVRSRRSWRSTTE